MKRSLSVLMMAVLFTFSLLSNCYCSPFVSAKEEPAPKSHCEHHSGKPAKNQDCSPRFNADYFEAGSGKIFSAVLSSVQPESVPVLTVKKPEPFLSFEHRPFLAASPPIYILVRSLLI